MALVSRLTRLFRADAHAVLDRLEEPDVLLRQAVREMEEEVARNAQALKALELDHEQTRARIAQIESSLTGIAGELDLCFAVDNQNLVRTLLRRRLEAERLVRHLTQRLTRVAAEIAQRRSALEDQRQRLEGMRQKAAIFDIDASLNRSGIDKSDAAGDTPDIAVTEDDIDLALLREQQQRKVS
jgi:phage shock protein A